MKNLALMLFVCVVIGGPLVVSVPAQETNGGALNDRASSNAHAARYTDDGRLVRPKGWRKWVYVGTPLTPNDMNNGAAAFQEFHNVYVDPESFATFERTGTFPNGTQLAKELEGISKL